MKAWSWHAEVVPRDLLPAQGSPCPAAGRPGYIETCNCRVRISGPGVQFPPVAANDGLMNTTELDGARFEVEDPALKVSLDTTARARTSPADPRPAMVSPVARCSDDALSVHRGVGSSEGPPIRLTLSLLLVIAVPLPGEARRGEPIPGGCRPVSGA